MTAVQGERRTHSGRRRSAARLAAVQALYQIELAGASAESVIREFEQHGLGTDREGGRLGEADAQLFGDLVRGVAGRQDELDQLIAGSLAPGWPLARLEAVLRAILRAGAFELLVATDVPAPVVISEYLDIAHAFFAGKEPGLVNGVLDHLARTLRPAQELGSVRDGTAAPR